MTEEKKQKIDLSAFKMQPNDQSSVKKVIGVISGKGGVGKSLVTALLASSSQKKGYKTAIMDADLTGPSIPKLFGLTAKAQAGPNGLIPLASKEGIDIMSVNLLLEDETDPVVWRGPMISSIIKQFWTEVLWENEDYLFVDMPPGTGDVALTVFQAMPVDGIVIVTSPQELVSMIVKKAVKMAKKMDIPILGIVENMSYFECPSCGQRHEIFGKSHIEDIADDFGLEVLAKLPIDPSFAKASDEGKIEDLDLAVMDKAIARIDEKTDKLD